MTTVGGVLANASWRVSPPRIPISSSLTILTTCWAGFSAPETSAPLARSLMRATNARTTGSETSASSSASRISRVVASMSASVSRPLPRRPCRAPVNRSDRDSNTSSSLAGVLGSGFSGRGAGSTDSTGRARSVVAQTRTGRRSTVAQSPAATMPNTSTTDEPSVVTFAHAMSTPSRSKTAVSPASRPARSVARICTSSSPGRAPSDHRIRGGAGTWLIGTAAGTSPARRRAVLRGVAVAAIQRRHARRVRRRGPG